MTRRRRLQIGRVVSLALILALAAVLRLRGIGHDSLWGDESLSYQLARMSFYDMVKYSTWFEQIPPVHHIVLHFWIKVFGTSETALRIPSAIFGVAGVWMMYVLVSRLLGRRTGRVAALLLAVSPMHIAYSQECRAYSLMVLLGLVLSDLFVRLLRRPTQRLHTWYVIVAALLLYTHLYGIFTILAHQVVYVFSLWRTRARLPLRPKPFLVDNLAIAALFSMWVPIVLQWTKLVAERFWVKVVTMDDVTRAYWVYSGSTGVLLAMTALLVVGVWRWRRRSAGVALLLALMLTPVVVPVTISVLTRPSFAPRYGIMGCAGLCALAAAGITALRPAGLRLLVLAALVIASPMGDAAVIPRVNWRRAGQFLTANMRPDDLAVCHLRVGTRLFDYYVDRPEVRRLGVDTMTIPVTLPMNGRRVWLVIYDPWYPANVILKRGNWRIERRLLQPGVFVMELTDEPEPEATTAPTTSSSAPPTPASKTSAATTRPTPTP